MEYKWLNREKNSNVIIFFNGWGMDENIVSNLSFEGFDVLMFYDYSTLNTDFKFSALQQYEERFIVAWSMGVMVATLFEDKIGKLNGATAINGTLKPIDNRYGIPTKIYDLTIKGFTEESSEKFIKNMGVDKYSQACSNRTFVSRKHELEALKTYNSNEKFKYTRILISDNDKIIPSKNQSAFWKIEPNIKGAHYIFDKFKSWKELL